VKKGSAVSAPDARKLRIRCQFALDVFQQSDTATAHHERQCMRENRPIARESGFERRTLRQFDSTDCISFANRCYKIIKCPLFDPALRHFAPDFPGIMIVRRIR
jgi:hypothetical protein